MKQFFIYLSICLLLMGLSTSGQTIQELTFGTDTTFEVMTWNIEWFPKNGQTTVDYVSGIIESLDVDLLAIQEVDDTDAFEQMAAGLESYDGYLESGWFAGLAFIYKPALIQINDIYEIYTTSPYWSPFPRSPMVMDLNFQNERVIVINNHFKCCGDGILNLDDPDDEETRRYYASKLLKEYIDLHFPNENVIVLGDLNDILTDDNQNNVFQLILVDIENYQFADYEIAGGDISEWSYPTWPSHLDHILISNELFDDFETEGSAISTIKIDQYLVGGWWEYEQNISDHRPVALKLNLNSNLGRTDHRLIAPHFRCCPNPVHSETTLSFNMAHGTLKIEIVNLQGQRVFSKKIPGNASSITWDAEGLPNGIYLARLLSDHRTLATLKILRRK
ncbi:MAG: endonuclease/exonuclease/phosphatase family protein [Bacteroidetes bacterium]|nr:endonuclease/exonuclease/phosphatase family protein [Bacteroidota bacterium]